MYSTQSLEIAPWDGMYMLILSRDAGIVSSFRAHFPAEATQDLAEYNLSNRL